jgi:hypothetical protein
MLLLLRSTCRSSYKIRIKIFTKEKKKGKKEELPGGKGSGLEFAGIETNQMDQSTPHFFIVFIYNLPGFL